MKKSSKVSKLKLRRLERFAVPDVEIPILSQVVGGDPVDDQTGCGSCTQPNTIFLTTSYP